jgi:hypothetical protein
MAEDRDWNFWKNETISDPVLNRRVISIYEGKDLDEGDIRNENFNLNTRKWCLEIYWDAMQASFISFGRDPGKFKADSYSPFDESDDDYLKHLELMSMIEARYRQIVAAQNEGYLNRDFFFPAVYIGWSERLKLSFPPYVKKELMFIDRERRGEVKPSKHFAGMYIEVSETPEETEQAPAKTGGGQQKRLENNLTKILFAVLSKSKLVKEDVDELVKDLHTILATMAEKRADADFAPTGATIKKRILEALDLLK